MIVSSTWRLFMLKNFIRIQKENVYHKQSINTIHRYAYSVYRVDQTIVTITYLNKGKDQRAQITKLNI